MTDNTLKPYVIGLDLGGTNSVFGIVDARGEIKATTAIKTGGYEKVEDYVKIFLGHTTEWYHWPTCSAKPSAACL